MTTNKKNTYFSYNGRQALSNGEKTLKMWDRRTMLQVLQQTYKRYKADDWTMISTKVMQQKLLRKSSWHHINGKPVWFYTMEPERVTHDLILTMQRLSAAQTQKECKPTLAKVNRTVWKWSQNNEHQYAVKKSQMAVVYHGYAYFENGKSAKVERGKCEVAHSCGKIVKDKRILFEKIVHQMRTQYAIAI